MKKYVVAGHHPCMNVLIKALDKLGYEQVLKNADFSISGNVESNQLYSYSFCKQIPHIFLSSAKVYSCLGHDGKVREVPFNESMPLVVPSTVASLEQIRAIHEEAYVLNKIGTSNLTLRICNAFGEDIVDNPSLGSVSNYHLSSKRSFLYQDDLEDAFTRIIPLFVAGVRGLYNVGADEVVTQKHAIKTYYQLMHGTPEIDTIHINSPQFHNFYEVVDSTRFSSLTGWKTKSSFRRGMWFWAQRSRA